MSTFFTLSIRSITYKYNDFFVVVLLSFKVFLVLP